MLTSLETACQSSLLPLSFTRYPSKPKAGSGRVSNTATGQAQHTAQQAAQTAATPGPNSGWCEAATPPNRCLITRWTASKHMEGGRQAEQSGPHRRPDNRVQLLNPTPTSRSNSATLMCCASVEKLSATFASAECKTRRKRKLLRQNGTTAYVGT